MTLYERLKALHMDEVNSYLAVYHYWNSLNRRDIEDLKARCDKAIEVMLREIELEAG